MANPYLQAQQDAISGQVNNNLQRNVLPGIGRRAMAAGGYGGSRQGISEGIGIGESSRAIADATANLQGNAYAQDQQIASQQSMQQAQLAAQERMASQSNDTQRLGLNNQYSLGLGQLGLGYQTAGQNYELGKGNLGLGWQNSNNQYALGNRAADTNQFQAQTSRDLGFGQLGLGYQTAGQNYELGKGNLGLGWQNSNNQYALGNRAADTNQFQAQTSRDLGFGQLGAQQDANDMSFYTAQRGQDLSAQNQGFNQWLSAFNAQNGMGQQQANIGTQQQQAPWTAIGNYQNTLQPFTGLNGSSSQSSGGTGGGWAGAAGGALTAAQLWQLMNGGG